MNKIIWNQNEVNVDDVLAYNIMMNVIYEWQWGSRLSTKKWLAKWKDEIEA